MSSTFTWLDYSEHDRRRALNVISLFSERDTRDDLGLGTGGISISEAVGRQLEISAAKYPVDKARGSVRKYTDLGPQ